MNIGQGGNHLPAPALLNGRNARQAPVLAPIVAGRDAELLVEG
jgi:hypothetical protein